jgi:hypothetical protein
MGGRDKDRSCELEANGMYNATVLAKGDKDSGLGGHGWERRRAIRDVWDMEGN